MTHIFCLDDVVILDCSVRDITEMKIGKDAIQLLRNRQLQEIFKVADTKMQRGKKEGLLKAANTEGGSDFGHCAETWGFFLFREL